MYFLLSVCENPDVLRFIYLGIKLINLVFLLLPIALIVFIIIDLSKMVFSGDEKTEKKSIRTIINRAIFAVLLFFVPTIVGAVINLLSDSGLAYYTNENGEKITYQQCLDNANLEIINKLEKEQSENKDENKDENKNNVANSSGGNH